MRRALIGFSCAAEGKYGEAETLLKATIETRRPLGRDDDEELSLLQSAARQGKANKPRRNEAAKTAGGNPREMRPKTTRRHEANEAAKTAAALSPTARAEAEARAAAEEVELLAMLELDSGGTAKSENNRSKGKR